MPLLILVAGVFVMFAVILLSMPLTIIQRYRMGKARRLARSWVATLNVFAMITSAAVFLAAAALTSVWVPRAFAYSTMGLAAGLLLGFLGIALTRWEVTPESLHYTPNRWLVLSLTLIVAARLVYGFWRGWAMWRSAPGEMSWLAASGAAGAMAVGAVVLGYYLAYWAGVRGRIRRHTRTATRA